MEEKIAWLRSLIRDVPGFPKEGIVFKDITTLIRDKKAFRAMTDAIADRYSDEKIDLVASVDARGFIIGSAVAYKLGAGLIPLRKPGKLPAETLYCEFELEYGTDRIEIHTDAIEPGQRVLVVDDLLATGGTAQATCDLVKRLGGELVGVAFLVELAFLGGRDKLTGFPVFSLIKYDSE